MEYLYHLVSMVYLGGSSNLLFRPWHDESSLPPSRPEFLAQEDAYVECKHDVFRDIIGSGTECLRFFSLDKGWLIYT
jgi:hypothetical protein